VPGVWWFEVRNSLVVNERRGRLSETETAAFLRNLAQLSIHIDRDPAEASVLSLARQHRLTVYDAAYLELAQREGLALATLDTALRQAASAIGVPLLVEAV
jgi:predicted nucleic acid-binding protein